MSESPLDAIVSRMTWRTPDGDAVDIGSTLHIGAALKDAEDRSRQVRAAEWNGKPLVLKLRHWRRLKRRWLAARGRSPIANERNMMRAAAAAGLRTPTIIAHGRASRLGLVTHEALLFERFVDLTPLRQIGLRRFKEQDAAFLDVMAAMLIRHVSSLRRAGLSDRDCGGHNLLVPDNGSLDEPPVWIDLEAVRRAAPDEPEATLQTCAAVLMSWWEHASRDEAKFHALWRQMMDALPAPASGWQALIVPLNKLLRDRGDKQMRHARSDRLPPPLSVS